MKKETHFVVVVIAVVYVVVVRSIGNLLTVMHI